MRGVTMCLPFFSPRARATPLMAMLLDSVLPEVKTNSSACAPKPRQRRPAGLVQRLAGLDAQGVTELRGGHGVGIEEVGLHRLEHALVEARGGGVVQIDGLAEHGRVPI